MGHLQMKGTLSRPINFEIYALFEFRPGALAVYHRPALQDWKNVRTSKRYAESSRT